MHSYFKFKISTHLHVLFQYCDFYKLLNFVKLNFLSFEITGSLCLFDAGGREREEERKERQEGEKGKEKQKGWKERKERKGRRGWLKIHRIAYDSSTFIGLYRRRKLSENSLN